VNTDELMAVACPKIRDLGWAHYFAPETMERATELGLDGFRFYFLGRGGVLGDADGAVVASAFGFFEPTLLTSMWDSAREVLAPREAGREYFACAAAYGGAHLSEIPGLDGFCAALEAVDAAADPVGLALYAGASAEPRADDLPARAMQLVSVLRELRGSAHLVALRAVGLPDRVAHAINRPNDQEMFGWSAGQVPEVTDGDRELLVEAEAITDRIVAPAYDVLDAAGQASLLDGLAAMEAALVPAG
jgi:hypothetical protein